MRTGDEAVVRKSPKGTEHIFIVDPRKEPIKVKADAIAGSKLQRNDILYIGAVRIWFIDLHLQEC